MRIGHPNHTCLGEQKGKDYNVADEVMGRSVYMFDVSEITLIDVSLAFDFIKEYQPKLFSKADVVMIYRPYRPFRKNIYGSAYQTGRIGIIKLVFPTLRFRRMLRAGYFSDMYLVHVFQCLWHELEHLRGNHGVYPDEKDEEAYRVFLASRQKELSETDS